MKVSYRKVDWFLLVYEKLNLLICSGRFVLIVRVAHFGGESKANVAPLGDRKGILDPPLVAERECKVLKVRPERCNWDAQVIAHEAIESFQLEVDIEIDLPLSVGRGYVD